MIAELQAGRFATKLSGTVVQRSTGLGSTASAIVEPLGAEMARAGRRFILGNSAAITGIAPVQALPTTAAQWVLWNASATKMAFFESLGVYLTAGTPGVGGTLLGALVNAPAQVGSTYAGTAISSASLGSIASLMVVKANVTVTDPVAPNWHPLASNPSPNVTAFAASVFLENRGLQGMLAIPPGKGLALCVVAPAGTTPLFAPFGMWVELESDAE